MGPKATLEMVNKMTNREKSSMIKLAVNTFGYLLGWRSKVTMVEFAALVKKHSTSPQALQIAEVLEGVDGFVERTWREFRAAWVVN